MAGRQGGVRVENRDNRRPRGCLVDRRSVPRSGLLDRRSHSFAVMERLGLTRAASFDDDFAVYRYGRNRDRAFENFALRIGSVCVQAYGALRVLPFASPRTSSAKFGIAFHRSRGIRHDLSRLPLDVIGIVTNARAAFAAAVLATGCLLIDGAIVVANAQTSDAAALAALKPPTDARRRRPIENQALSTSAASCSSIPRCPPPARPPA